MKRILLFAFFTLPVLLLAQAPTATFTPANGATNVSLTNNLTIAYNQAIRNMDDSNITNGNVESLIVLSDGGTVSIDATISGNTITVDPDAPLAEETTYTLSVSAVENSSNQSTGPLSITFTTGDFTDPTLNSARIINNTGTTFTFEATINDQGTIYYVVTPSSTIPTEAQVEAGQDHTGAAVAAGRFGSFAVTANTPGTASITGLTAGTKYRVHFFGRDEGGNDFDPTTRNEPQINGGNTSAHTPTTTGFTFTAEFDMDGTVYYVVNTSATPPSAATILAGSGFAVTDDDQINEAITGLNGATTYYVHFIHQNNSGSHSEIATRSASTLDGAPPVITPFNGANVDIGITSLTFTFDEIVDNISTAATIDDHKILIHEGTFPTPVATYKIGRDVLIADGTDNTVEALISSAVPALTLKPFTHYYVTMGNAVIEDFPADNDFPGISTGTVYEFTTSGVTINNLVNNICSGSLQTLSDIEINETGIDDFNNSGSIVLELVNTTDFAFSTSGITLSETGSDITVGTPTATFSTITIPYTRSGGTTVDKIIVSGIKVLATGGSLSTTIRRSGGTASQDGNNATGASSLIYAQISVGASPPAAPTLAAAQDVSFCQNENISASQVAVNNDGGTFNWYSNSSLTTLLATGHQVNISGGAGTLGISSASVGQVKRYVVRISGCQSSALEVTFDINSLPVADAGPATASTCAGTAISIGGFPTLIVPSSPGTYTYDWSTTSPTGFSNLGANPSVNPPNATAGDIVVTYTVRVTDSKGCQSDITDPNASIALTVRTIAQAINYTSPLSTSFTLDSDPVLLTATPSINIVYSGNGVYKTGANYYFDPDLAGTTGSPHTITYTTDLTNGCRKTVTRNFTVSASSGSIINLASSYCTNESADNTEILALGPQWTSYLASDNAFYAANYGYTYEFYDFQAYTSAGLVGPGVVTPGLPGTGSQYINPTVLQPYVPGANYTYIAMRVRQKTPRIFPAIGFDYGPPIFWMYQFINIYTPPTVFITGLSNGQNVCDINQNITISGNFTGGTFEISRNGTTFFVNSSPGFGNPPASDYGLYNDPANPGQAVFNPSEAFNSTGFTGFPAGTNSPVAFTIRYTYQQPGTSSSSGALCGRSTTITINVNPLPSVAFAATPVNNQQYCYDDPSVALSATGPNVTFLGYGITNISSGSATFDPDAAFIAKEFADNTTHTTMQTVTIIARATSAVGCSNEVTRNLRVRPLPPATFTAPPRLVYCYEDVPFNIDGAQSNSFYQIVYRNTSPVNYTQFHGSLPGSPQSDLSFNAKTFFDNAVAQGASALDAQNFDITYTTDDGSGLGCTNATTISLIVNPPSVLNINGTNPGDVFCENGGVINLTGNFTGSGRFETSVNGSVFSSSGNGLINGNLPGGDGTASLNLLQAYDEANNIAGPNSPREPFYVRYIYRGPTCTGDAVYTDAIEIVTPPSLSFIGATPSDNTAFCYDQSLSPASVPIITNTPANSTLTLTGTGTAYNSGTGIGSFNPTLAFKQRELDLNTTLPTDQSFVVTARAQDNTYGCVTTITKPLTARALPQSAFTYGNKLNYCYEDNIQALDGQQITASYKIVYKNTTTPANYEVTINQPDITFDPDVYFEDAVLKGANRLATLRFDVVYTATAGTGCTNRLDTVKFNVSPLIKGEIKGIDNNDIFCSNVTDKKLEFTPSNGTFRINGTITPVINDQYIFDPPIPGPAAGTNYTFTYTVITGSNCTNTETKAIKVLPSPRALFSVTPKCDTALIAFNALSSTNLGSTAYTWTLSDSVRGGQNLQHRFPGVSTYSVQLKAEHPPFTTVNGPLVCADSLRLDQIVGPYPRIDFDFFNVCEEDNTNFDVNSNIPISDVRWEFGDDPGIGDVIPFGLMSNNIPGAYAPTTTGTFEKPRHQYAGAGNYLVTVMGRTANNFGGCVDTVSRQISILKKIIPPGNNYSMADLDGGRGHWVVEDQAGNSSWEFAVPNGARIKGTTPAWTTDADGTYLADDNSYVNSPCFDLSGYVRPVISMQQWIDTPPSDGAVLQVSLNGGQTWNRVGNIASGLEWYNRLTISSNPGEQVALSTGWSKEDQVAWATGKHSLDAIPVAARGQVRFRIAFASFNNKEAKDGFAFSNVVIEERNKTILVENFTNLTSIDNNTSFQNFRANPVTKTFNLNELVKLQYHTGVAGADQLFNESPVDQNARAAFYGVTQTNRAYIDGGYDFTAPNQTFQANWIDNYFSLRSLVTSPLTITTPATLPTDPSDKFNVQAIITADANIPAGKYHVFIAIAEKNVLDQRYVLRKLLPDASGVPLTALTPTSPQQVIDVSYDLRNVTKNSTGNFNPIAVIIFVQDIEGNKEVLQTYIREIDTPPTNIVSGVEGSEALLFRVYPNPADKEMIVTLPEAAKQRTALFMYDQLGKLVKETHFEKGEHEKTITTESLSGGVYLIQVDTPKGVLRRKTMVLHRN